MAIVYNFSADQVVLPKDVFKEVDNLLSLGRSKSLFSSLNGGMN
jgi:hypothetical protein